MTKEIWQFMKNGHLEICNTLISSAYITSYIVDFSGILFGLKLA